MRAIVWFLLLRESCRNAGRKLRQLVDMLAIQPLLGEKERAVRGNDDALGLGQPGDDLADLAIRSDAVDAAVFPVGEDEAALCVEREVVGATKAMREELGCVDRWRQGRRGRGSWRIRHPHGWRRRAATRRPVRAASNTQE